MDVLIFVLCVCVCVCVWSDQCEFMAFLMVFNFWIGVGFIFESCS